MKKFLLCAAALCAFSVFAAVNEQLDLEKLKQQYQALHMNLMITEAVLTIRHFQDSACTGKMSLEQIKEVVETMWSSLKNIPADDSEQARMSRYLLEILKDAITIVSDATYKNELPAVDPQTFKKGTDAQATRIKVISIIKECIQ